MSAEPARPVCQRFNLPNNAQQLRASTTTQREKLRTHCRVVRPTRRASAQSYAQCGVDNDKKVLLDFFQKIAGSSGQSPWSLHRNGAKSLIHKTSSARGSKMPAGILRRGRIARASPMEKVRSMRAFSINVRAVNYQLRTHWNYVGRHGLLTQE